MAGVTRPATAILLQTHMFEGAVRRLYQALQRACGPNDTLFVLMHVSPGTPKPSALDGLRTHFVTTTEIRVPEFAGKSFGENWSIWSGGHTDLIALHFARQHTEFEHYWVIEYDVRFTGRWRGFLDHFGDSRADLLATTLQSFETNQDWSWWNSVASPDGKPVGKSGLICAFMPIFRFSRAAALEMERRYQQGWTGHTEVTWPSFLYEAGLIIEDLGGTGAYVTPRNRGRFYKNRPHEWSFGPGTLVWRPARLVAGLRRNWLYHPVKPPMLAIQDQWDYRWNRFRRFAGQKRRATRAAVMQLLRRIDGSDAV